MTTQFQNGNPGGPGRDKGSKNIGTQVRELLDQDLVDLAKAVLKKALERNSESAAKFVLKYALGTPRGAIVQIDLPPIDTAAGVDAAQEAVIQATKVGQVPVGDANTLFDMLEKRRKGIETRTLERRVEAALRAREENHAFARAVEETARGEGTSTAADEDVAKGKGLPANVAALEAQARPDLSLEQRYEVIADRFFETATADEARRVQDVARQVHAEHVAAGIWVEPAPEPETESPPEQSPPEPPPPEMTPQLAWIEEHVRWRPRGEPDPYQWDEVNNRPIVHKPLPPNRVESDYDPLA